MLYFQCSLCTAIKTSHQLGKSLRLAPWFSTHLQRDVYFSLLHLDQGYSEKDKKPVPDTVLKAALLRRATADIQRLIKLRNQKPALASLFQRGSVGEVLWQRFTRAEQDMDNEIRDVIFEVGSLFPHNETNIDSVTKANTFAPGWGQIIFQTANEMVINFSLRQKIQTLQVTTNNERVEWECKKAQIHEQFMQELETNPDTETNVKTVGRQEKSGNEDDIVFVESQASTSGKVAIGKKKKKGKK